MSPSTQPTMPAVPAYAMRVVDALEAAGHEAWVVGGWVRDALMGSPSHDVDVACSALWQDSARTLRTAGIEVHETGTRHGTVTAVVGGRPVEVTTYRVEGSYSDHRHPDAVRFVRDIRQDLARRDLTVNAMAYHPQRGLLDPFGGTDDIRLRLVRATGDPWVRFDEDALRVLRAVRFACRLGFSIEDGTSRALDACARELAHVSRERVGQEMDGIVRSGRLAWAMREHPRVLCSAIPELSPMVGFDQRSPYHCFDVWGHTVRVVEGVESVCAGSPSARLRWAAFLHDVGKPHTFTVDATGRGHFFGHPSAGAHMAGDVMRRLALPGDLVRPVVALVRHHDRPVRATRHSVLRMLSDVDGSCPGQARVLAFELVSLKRADALGKAPCYRDYAAELDHVDATLRSTLGERAPFRVGDLAITGRDIIAAAGMKPGRWVGEVLDQCLREVVHGRLPNTRETLMAWLDQG